MSLDEGMSEGTSWEESGLSRHDLRICEIVALAKKESPGITHPVDREDFFDLYCNGGGYITNLNEPYCGIYSKHRLELWGEGFSCVTDKPTFIVDTLTF